MPFTFSHPALILPVCVLNKRFFSLSALVIGSITPDFEYFLRMSKGTTYYSHSVPGLFYFNLPMGLLLLFLFHEVIRRQLINHLPLWLYKRFRTYYDFEFIPYFKKKWIIVLCSLFIGAATHLGWDWFTHESADYMYYHQHELLFFSSWQHHSIIYLMVHITHSVLGLAALGVAIYRMPVVEKAKRTNNITMYWIFISILTALVATIRLVFLEEINVGDVAISLLTAFLSGIIFISLVIGKRVNSRG